MLAFFLFIGAFLAGLMAKFRWRERLLASGLLIAASGVAWIYLPGYLWGDATYRMAFWGFVPVAGGAGLSLGLLARTSADLWPVLDSSLWWSRCLRLLLVISVFTLGSFGLLAGVVILGKEPMQRERRFEMADVRSVFSKAVKEGQLTASFDLAKDFIVTSRHGTQPYIISFENSEGQRAGFMVCSVPGGWEFWPLRERGRDAKVVLPREKTPY